MGNSSCCSQTKPKQTNDVRRARTGTAMQLNLEKRFINQANLSEQLVPSDEELSKINAIAHQPDYVNLSTREEFLLWRFRYYLKDKRPDMLAKVLQGCQWKQKADREELL